MLSFLVDFISSLFAQSRSIAGHWRRVEFGEKNHYSDTQHHYRDLIIAKDSTYTFVGDAHAQRSQIPGWNTGETRKGKWALHGKNFIDLYDGDLGLPLVYRIRKLTKKELHLGRNQKDFPVMRYKRIV